MNMAPLFALVFGYGLAAIGAAVAWVFLGAAGSLALLGFWLCGAVLTLVTAATTREHRPVDILAEDPDVASDLLGWEEDRASEAAHVERDGRRRA